MIVFPAIDLKDGRPVRLTQGDFSTTEQVADDALKTALRFEQTGATHLHMVDLDGAVTGAPVHFDLVKNVVNGTRLRVEIGGGIRSESDIVKYLDAGVWRVILGSVAITDPEFAKSMIGKYGAGIAVGIDAKDGFARGGGWIESGTVRFTELAKAMDEAGVRAIIHTDISKDGTLSGPNLDDLRELIATVRTDIVASGGVSDLTDIENLAKIGCAGVICGKSLYRGTLKLEDALRIA